MRKISTFFYHLGQGFIGIFRNGVMSTASVLVLVSCMLIVGTFYIVIDNLDRNLKSIDDINLICIYLDDELTEEQINYIDGQIDKIGQELGNIVDYKLYSKTDNLERYKKNKDENADFLKFYNEHNNPLPNSFEIHFTSFSDPEFKMDDVYKLKNRLDEIENIDNDDIKENIELYDKVTGVSNTLTMIGIWMMAILLIVATFVIMNTIKLGMHSRRNEIVFMRYVGATKRFIRTPFIIEGIIIGIFSAGISLGLQYYIYQYIISDAFSGSTGVLDSVESVAAIEFAPFSEYIKLLALVFLGLGFFSGVIASSISIKKYLKA